MKLISRIASVAVIVIVIVSTILYLTAPADGDTEKRISFKKDRFYKETITLTDSLSFNFKTTRFKVSKRNIFIWDFTNKKIHILDKDLNYKAVIGQNGNGPSDFRRVISIDVNESTNEIEIFDSENSSFKFFNLNTFKFLRVERVNFLKELDKSLRLENGSFILSSWEKNNTLGFWKLDPSSQDSPQALPISNQFEYKNSAIIDEGFFTKNSCGNIFFASHQKDKIYELSNLGELVQIIEPIYETADPEILEGPNFVAPINYVHHLTDIKAKCGEIHLLSNIGDKQGNRVIDVYNTKTGDYIKSVSTPKISEQLPVSIEIEDSRQIFILYDNTLVKGSYETVQ